MMNASANISRFPRSAGADNLSDASASDEVARPSAEADLNDARAIAANAKDAPAESIASHLATGKVEPHALFAIFCMRFRHTLRLRFGRKYEDVFYGVTCFQVLVAFRL